MDRHELQYYSPLYSLDPHWGPQEDSTFILHCLAAKLYDHDLLLVVKDYDALTMDDDLGTVLISAPDVYRGRGTEMERKITPPPGQEGKDAGYLTIRCRKATQEDIESIAKGEQRQLFQFKTGVFDHTTMNTLL